MTPDPDDQIADDRPFRLVLTATARAQLEMIAATEGITLEEAREQVRSAMESEIGRPLRWEEDDGG